MKAIPLSSEKYKAVYVNKLVFIDSAGFAAGSLASLTETLKVSDHDFGVLAQWPRLRARSVVESPYYPFAVHREIDPRAPEVNESEETPEAELERLTAGPLAQEAGDYVRSVLTRRRELSMLKGIFPYEHCVGGAAQLAKESWLPPAESFYSRLTGEEVTEEDYERAQSVFHYFHCGSMLDYCSVYVELDVYLLAEVVHAMRSKMHELFGLDMLQYLSLPHMAKDVMLKVTGAEMELLSDYDMVHFIRGSLRGGQSFMGKRLVELDTWPTMKAAREMAEELGEEWPGPTYEIDDHTTYDNEGGEPSCIIDIDA